MSAVLLAPPASLYDALFPHSKPHVISAVGGGGKTTFLKTLAAELSARGARIILTTTTKMHTPENPLLLGTTVEEVSVLLKKHPIVWAGVPVTREKMTSIPEAIAQLKTAADYILVEADGSRKHPLKMTDPSYEPVIPLETDAVVALAGLDGLGMPAGEVVHRSALACQLLQIAENHRITPTDVARLLLHCYAPRYVLLNKADTPELQEKGFCIASLLSEAHCLIASLRSWGQAENR